MLDQAHRRLTAIERKLSKFEMNPAPTVPQYDLEASIPSATITNFSGFFYKTGTIMPDQILINICADGGTIPGAVLGSCTCDGISGGGMVDAGRPSPDVTLPVGSTFWVWLGRTMAEPYSSAFNYVCGYGPDTPVGLGRAGIPDFTTGLFNDGFQWWSNDDHVWYAFTPHSLAVDITFDDGNSIINPYQGSGGIPFGRGSSNSLYVASKFIVP